MDNDEEEEAPAGTIRAKIASRVNSIMTQNRQCNMVRVHISSIHESLVLIDGGADTSMLGPEFHIES